MRYLVVAAVAIFALVGASAADVASGVAAYRQGDYATAMREVLPAGERGDATAQYYAGAMYEGGLGIEQSYVEALKWYRAAAEQGMVMAQYHLGVFYEIGQGTARNHVTAIEWCLRAARRGFGPAQSNLGSPYLRGASNIETSPFEAHVWASLAEGQNFPGAKEMRMNAERMLSREEISEAAMP